MVVATTVRRIGARHRSLRALVCSAEKSVLLRFPHAFGSPPHLLSTREKRIPGSGSTTTTWRASWAARPMTPSSFATFPCILRILRARGSNIFPPTRSTTSPTWLEPSWATSRAHTRVLGTLGISEGAVSNLTSPCETTSDASPSNVPSSPASPTPKSLVPFIWAQHAGISCASWDETLLPMQTNYLM